MAGPPCHEGSTCRTNPAEAPPKRFGDLGRRRTTHFRRPAIPGKRTVPNTLPQDTADALNRLVDRIGRSAQFNGQCLGSDVAGVAVLDELFVRRRELFETATQGVEFGVEQVPSVQPQSRDFFQQGVVEMDFFGLLPPPVVVNLVLGDLARPANEIGSRDELGRLIENDDAGLLKNFLSVGQAGGARSGYGRRCAAGFARTNGGTPSGRMVSARKSRLSDVIRAVRLFSVHPNLGNVKDPKNWHPKPRKNKKRGDKR